MAVVSDRFVSGSGLFGPRQCHRGALGLRFRVLEAAGCEMSAAFVGGLCIFACDLHRHANAAIAQLRCWEGATAAIAATWEKYQRCASTDTGKM